MPDLDRRAAEVVDAAQRFVTRAVAGLKDRVDRLYELTASLDDRIKAISVPQRGEKGDKGEKGEVAEVDYARIDAMLADAVAKIGLKEMIVGELGAELAKVPRAKDGENGRDGKDADTALIERIVRGELAQAILALPKPENGKDGKSVTLEDVRPLVDGVIREAVSKIPVPKDGADGFGLDDFSVALKEDGRTLSFRFARGEVIKEHEVRLAIPLDTGVYRQGRGYVKGDGATWNGSWFIAQVDNPQARPETAGGEWRLAVKRGVDGKDGKSVKGDPGPVGRPGRDLTQMGFDGRKY